MKKIEEIMGLVDEVEDLSAGIMMANEHSNCASEEEARMSQVKKAIESALRELVERKPLSDEEISVIADKHRYSYSSSGFDFEEFDDVEFCREIERAHGIGA